MGWLRFRNASGSGEVSLDANPTTVGRAPDCSLVLADGTVSRVHFEIHREGAGWRVVDRSRYGTLLNGTPLLTSSLPLVPGDRLRAGYTDMDFEIRRVPLTRAAPGDCRAVPEPIRAAGYWFDGFLPSDLPIAEALIDPTWDETERAAVAAYLRAGVTQEERWGHPPCRFGCGVGDERVGASDCTDGAWVWPLSLAHHVQHHAVRVPETLVERALSHAGEVAPFPEDTPVELATWTGWARSRGACVDLGPPWRVLAPSRLTGSRAAGRPLLTWSEFSTALDRTVGPEREQGGAYSELQKEMGAGHPLAGIDVIAVAARDDEDEVLFYIHETGRLAIVHLTWSGRRETDPAWPATSFVDGWRSWNAFRGAGARS